MNDNTNQYSKLEDYLGDHGKMLEKATKFANEWSTYGGGNYNKPMGVQSTSTGATSFDFYNYSSPKWNQFKYENPQVEDFEVHDIGSIPGAQYIYATNKVTDYDLYIYLIASEMIVISVIDKGGRSTMIPAADLLGYNYMNSLDLKGIMNNAIVNFNLKLVHIDPIAKIEQDITDAKINTIFTAQQPKKNVKKYSM